MLESAKTSYYRIKIDECDNNRQFGFINSLLSKNSLTPKLPKHNSMIDLANRLANFFHNKTADLHNSLNQQCATFFAIGPQFASQIISRAAMAIVSI